MEVTPYIALSIQTDTMAIETMTTGEACRAIHEDIDRLLKSIPPMVLELDTPLGGADVGCLIANIHECAERILELNNYPRGKNK